jgi:hypothetical protein
MFPFIVTALLNIRPVYSRICALLYSAHQKEKKGPNERIYNHAFCSTDIRKAERLVNRKRQKPVDRNVALDVSKGVPMYFLWVI